MLGVVEMSLSLVEDYMAKRDLEVFTVKDFSTIGKIIGKKSLEVYHEM
jgi:hypothetical protein